MGIQNADDATNNPREVKYKSPSEVFKKTPARRCVPTRASAGNSCINTIEVGAETSTTILSTNEIINLCQTIKTTKRQKQLKQNDHII